MSWSSNNTEGGYEQYSGNDWNHRDNNSYESINTDNNLNQMTNFQQRPVIDLEEAVTYCKYWQRGRCLHESSCSLFHPASELLPLPEMIILVGLPCSGKTHYFTQHFDNRGYRWINQSMTGSLHRVMNDIEEALERHVPVVIDRVNISVSQRAQFINIAKKWNIPVRCVVFKTPIDDCKILNEYRYYTAQISFYEQSSKRKPPFIHEESFDKYVAEDNEPTAEEGYYNITVVEGPSAEEMEKFKAEIPALKEKAAALEAQGPPKSYHDRGMNDRERRMPPRRDLRSRDFNQKSSYGNDRSRRDYGNDRFPRREYSEYDRPPRRDYGNDRPHRGFDDSRPPRREYGDDNREYGSNMRRDFNNDRRDFRDKRDYGSERYPRREYDDQNQQNRQNYGSWNNSSNYAPGNDTSTSWSQSSW